MVLYCEYRTDNQNETIFYKNGIAISSLEKSTNLTIEEVTQDQEGLYKCVSWDRKMESEASWLSVTLDQGQMFTLFYFLIFTKAGSLTPVHGSVFQAATLQKLRPLQMVK